MLAGKYALICRLNDGSISHIFGFSDDKEFIISLCKIYNYCKFTIISPDDKVMKCTYEVIHTQMYTFEIDILNRLGLNYV